MMPITYHETACPECKADLTQPDSVSVHYATQRERTFEQPSQIKPAKDDPTWGRLEDPEGLVRAGLHAGSYCAACDESLDELIPDPGDDEKTA